MAKKLEGSHPTSEEIVTAFVKLGLGDALGGPGPHTVFELEPAVERDTLEALCLPGSFTPEDIQSLFKDAGLLKAAPSKAA